MGHSSDMSQLVAGEGIINPGQGTIAFDAKFPAVGKSQGLPFTCSGKVETHYRSRVFGGVGSKLRGPFTCTDGRKGVANIKIVEVGECTGSGKDECGNVFNIYCAIDEETIEELREKYIEKINTSGREFVDKCELQGEAPEHYDPII